jgi:hypothetical protein
VFRNRVRKAATISVMMPRVRPRGRSRAGWCDSSAASGSC